jgi:hypothetical protein
MRRESGSIVANRIYVEKPRGSGLVEGGHHGASTGLARPARWARFSKASIGWSPRWCGFAKRRSVRARQATGATGATPQRASRSMPGW